MIVDDANDSGQRRRRKLWMPNITKMLISDDALALPNRIVIYWKSGGLFKPLDFV